MDFLRRKVDEGVIDLGYHGAHEPTYKNGIFSPYSHTEIEEMSWTELQELVSEDLTCWRRPFDGVYEDVEGAVLFIDHCTPDVWGGMLEVIEVLLNGGVGTPGIRVVTGLPYPIEMPAGELFEMALTLVGRYSLVPPSSEALYAPPAWVELGDGKRVTTPGALWAMCRALVILHDGGSLSDGDTIPAPDAPVRDQPVLESGNFNASHVWQVKPVIWR